MAQGPYFQAGCDGRVPDLGRRLEVREDRDVRGREGARLWRVRVSKIVELHRVVSHLCVFFTFLYRKGDFVSVHVLRMEEEKVQRKN